MSPSHASAATACIGENFLPTLIWMSRTLDAGTTYTIETANITCDTVIHLLQSNPLLARSIRNRFPYLDPLNHIQVELLSRYRGGDREERTRRGIHLTINGIAAGLRNSG